MTRAIKRTVYEEIHITKDELVQAMKAIGITLPSNLEYFHMNTSITGGDYRIRMELEGE